MRASAWFFSASSSDSKAPITSDFAYESVIGKLVYIWDKAITSDGWVEHPDVLVVLPARSDSEHAKALTVRASASAPARAQTRCRRR